MPRSVEEGFQDFLVKLKATQPENAAAKNHRASIEACLKNNFGLRRFARIGSFGNGTSVSGFSDVDYLACLPTDQLTNSSTYSLTKVRNVLDARFPLTGVVVSCPAISLPFGTLRSEDTEVVVGDFTKVEGGFNVYDIADCAGAWMSASPDAHNAYVTLVDNKHAGKVKPLIRFLKAWKFYRAVPISSFYLELRVARYADGETVIVYDIDVKNVLSKLLHGNLAVMRDPMGISGNISPCKSDALHADAISKLTTAVTRAENAVTARHVKDIKSAFDWWRLVYNDRFPTYYYT